MSSRPLQGLIAILRGVAPEEVVALGAALRIGGIATIEVPLNSPRPFDSIERLARAFGNEATIGAGTVLSASDVDRVADVGARVVLAPNFDAAVVARARARGLTVMPGVATPTEAFAALAAGAEVLKLFPGEMLGPPVLKAWRSVLPTGTPLFAVGGVGLHNLAQYKAAGAAGAGLGSSLYVPGMNADELESRARELHDAWAAG